MPYKKYTKSLFVFRRDLRLEDNLGLLAALTYSQEIFPVFIFDPRQIHSNQYFSAPAFEFMLQSLSQLDQIFKQINACLYFCQGQAHEEIARLIDAEKFNAVFLNKDYTPFSVERDFLIAEVCRKKNVAFEAFDDALLHNVDAVSKKDGGVYTVFTPYFRKASQIPVHRPQKISDVKNCGKFIKSKQILDISQFQMGVKNTWILQAGRRSALKILRNLQTQKNYSDLHDFPSLDATTHLSAHLKFGTCSVREVYQTVETILGIDHPLIRQLYWRDFFVQVGFHHPYVLGRSFHQKYEHIRWGNDQTKFKLWCEGQTGFPIVDAGMRQLNSTGFMHNRVRMIVASFLIKDLHIDWRLGERYFAQKLIDYDPLINNGNWQWAASTGCDAQPYFRIFNPWLQQKKFDKDAVYIKKWVPELSGLSVLQIHQLGDVFLSRPKDYPPPMVDHKTASQAAKKIYRTC